MSAALDTLSFVGWAMVAGDNDARGGLADDDCEGRLDWEGGVKRVENLPRHAPCQFLSP